MCVGESIMRVSITDEALNKIQLMVKQDTIRNPLIYLDIEGTCCHLHPKITVIEQTNTTFEIVTKINDLSISLSSTLTNLFKKNKEDSELKVNYKIPSGFSFQFK
jgi:hypothetical protein